MSRNMTVGFHGASLHQVHVTTAGVPAPKKMAKRSLEAEKEDIIPRAVIDGLTEGERTAVLAFAGRSKKEVEELLKPRSNREMEFPALPSTPKSAKKHIKGVGSLLPSKPAHIFSRPASRKVVESRSLEAISSSDSIPLVSADVYAVGTWACAACTFQNDNSVSECGMCGGPKESPAATGGGKKKNSRSGRRKVDLKSLLS